MADDEERGIVLTEQQLRARKRRNLAIALSLGALVVLFWVVTIFKLGGDVAQRNL